jgi:hypothetical protein
MINNIYLWVFGVGLLILTIMVTYLLLEMSKPSFKSDSK